MDIVLTRSELKLVIEVLPGKFRNIGQIDADRAAINGAIIGRAITVTG